MNLSIARLTQNWQIKGSAYTARSGDCLLVDTSGGDVNITLPPSPVANNFVKISDYAGLFSINHLLIDRNNSNIMRLPEDMIISNNNVSVTLVYIDETVGWLVL